MQITFSDTPRTVVPRWRPLAQTPAAELSSLKSLNPAMPWPEEFRVWQLEQWRTDRTLESSVDLFDYGVMTGDRNAELEGATGIVSNAADARPRLLQAARQAFSHPEVSHRPSALDAPLLQTGGHLTEHVRRLKHWVRQYPRDGLAHVELARAYAVLAEFAKARHHVLIAAQVSPENRYVLRSLTHFFCVTSEPDAALRALRQSEHFSVDPWLQSAEVAASQLAARPTRLPRRIITNLRQAKRVQQDNSELITGFASLEFENGVRRAKVRKLIEASLSNPTENALAQAIWISDRLGDNLIESHPETVFEQSAYEARAALLFNQKRFVESEREATLWLLDQPLEVRAALNVSYTNLIQLCDYKRAAAIAERGVELHSEDWSMLNCAAVTFAYAKRFGEAEVFVRALTRAAGHEEEALPFALAAQGLLAFKQGDAPTGRAKYEEAVEAAKKIARPDHVADAIIFWLEQEVEAGQIDPDTLNTELDRLADALGQIPAGSKRGVSDILEARAPVMRAAAEDRRNAQVTDYRPQPTMLLQA